MFELGARSKRISTTDLNVLMNQLAGKLGQFVKNVRINVSHSDLPKIQTDARMLGTVLKILLAEVLREWNEKDFKISVDSEVDKTHAVMTIQLPSHCPRSAFDSLLRLTQIHIGTARGRDVDQNPLGLALDHLLSGLEADVEIDAKASSIRISIPQPSPISAKTE